MLTVNVEPRPSPSLCACDRAAMHLDEIFDDGEPKAQAAGFACIAVVDWRKRSNAWAMKSLDMPCPLSITQTSMCEFTRCMTTRTNPSFGVNLIALLRRFQNTCCSRPGSPETLTVGSRICCSANLARLSARGDGFERRFDHLGQRHALHVQAQFSRDHPAHVEQVLHQARLQSRVALDDVETLLELRLVTAESGATPASIPGWR